jgi:uncharacterized protein DUF4331
MSDHFSGPRALAGPAGDICDIYAFPSPERPGHLVLAMTVLPLAGPEATFSDAIVCRFRLRPLAIEADRPAFSFGPEESELVFSCAFEAPRPGADGAGPVQDGRCSSPFGETARFQVHDERGGHEGGLRVYAGLRSDPFFIDLPAYQESLQTGRLAFKERGQNSLAGANALAVVVEVECGPLLQRSGTPLLGLVGETVVAGKLPIRIERFGRPEIKNVIMSMKEYDQVNRDLEIRDLYNLEDAFHLGKDYRGAYRARLDANLAAIDRLDGKTDWPLGPDGAHPLTALLLDDYLVVDVSKPYAEDSCLEIERAVLRGRPHETAGGRSLNDPTMATLYTLLVNAGNGPRISDGVDRATQPASEVFPYFAPPNPGPPGGLPVGDLIARVRQQAAAPSGAR